MHRSKKGIVLVWALMALSVSEVPHVETYNSSTTNMSGEARSIADLLLTAFAPLHEQYQTLPAAAAAVADGGVVPSYAAASSAAGPPTPLVPSPTPMLEAVQVLV